MVSSDIKRPVQTLIAQNQIEPENVTKKYLNYLQHTEHYSMHSNCTEVYQVSHY